MADLPGKKVQSSYMPVESSWPLQKEPQTRNKILLVCFYTYIFIQYLSTCVPLVVNKKTAAKKHPCLLILYLIQASAADKSCGEMVGFCTQGFNQVSGCYILMQGVITKNLGYSGIARFKKNMPPKKSCLQGHQSWTQREFKS